MPTTTPENSSTPFRGALVGFGNVAARAHLPLWQEHADFVIEAVVEPDPQRAELAAEILPQARRYTDLQQLLAKESLDFVDICTPPVQHEELVTAACRGGMHVFCEKPLVTTLASMKSIDRAASGNGRVVFTVNNWKHAPQWAKILELVHAGRIGRLQSVSLQVLRTPGSGGGASDWRRNREIAGGGILLDHGWHHLYLLLALFGEVPQAVAARLDSAPGHPAALEETAELAARFGSGEARLFLTWRAERRQNLGKLVGERGRLLLGDDHLVLEPTGEALQRFTFPEALSAGSHHLHWMRPVLTNFHAELVDPSRRGNNLEEASWCARLAEEAYNSHREGGGWRSLSSATPQGPAW